MPDSVNQKTGPWRRSCEIEGQFLAKADSVEVYHLLKGAGVGSEQLEKKTELIVGSYFS